MYMYIVQQLNFPYQSSSSACQSPSCIIWIKQLFPNIFILTHSNQSQSLFCFHRIDWTKSIIRDFIFPPSNINFLAINLNMHYLCRNLRSRFRWVCCCSEKNHLQCNTALIWTDPSVYTATDLIKHNLMRLRKAKGPNRHQSLTGNFTISFHFYVYSSLPSAINKYDA